MVDSDLETGVQLVDQVTHAEAQRLPVVAINLLALLVLAQVATPIRIAVADVVVAEAYAESEVVVAVEVGAVLRAQ